MACPRLVLFVALMSTLGQCDSFLAPLAHHPGKPWTGLTTPNAASHLPCLQHTQQRSSASHNRLASMKLSPSDFPAPPATNEGPCTAAVRRYWDGMNRRDVEYALAQFADDIVFQDMMFQEPFKDKKELRAHFEKCLDGFPEGLLFVIDDISNDSGDGKCGAFWHCETPEGKAFPFSRGLSYYACNEGGKLTFAREIPEPRGPRGSPSRASVPS
mmetsp:Transcript_9837/g.24059  ORF Transcript_9837/g.24059 Transcript_9837/m.24059 type:complete len:214 (-) Transcript_9837:158-799(-)